MKYLLDTCLISELVVKSPNLRVVQWVDEQDPANLFLSVITIGEISKGIAKLIDSRRKQKLESWLQNELLQRFSQNILSINMDVMLVWGRLMAALELKGRIMALMDSLIAALALHGNLHLVTRNEDDFINAGISILNPWKE
ncbi:MAG: type II toxin-antitoxin system VapC family toxin [Desulfobacteraceae bacterium]|nr:MAG: type II toxin-antitoxin system VapC family toxin [Desulfobacteraceae bacterium]